MNDVKSIVLDQLQLKILKSHKMTDWIRSPEMVKLSEAIARLVGKHGITQTVYADPCSIYVNLTLQGLEGLKDAALEEVLDTLLHSNPTSSSSTDHAEAFCRLYELTWRDPKADTVGIYHLPIFYLTVTANFKQDSSTCHRVIEGYTEAKVVAPKPIYRIECDEPKATEANQIKD